MRILFVASRLHPNYTDSLSALAKKHSLNVLVTWQAENERHEGLSLSHSPDGPISRLLEPLHRWAGLSSEQIAYRKRHPSLLFLVRFIHKHRIDTVYARRDNKHLLRTARIAAWLTGCRYVSYRQQIFDAAKPMDRHAVYPLRMAPSMDEAPANFIPLTIDLSRFPKCAPLPPYAPGGDEPLRIMAVGKLIERKGHHLLIRAIAQLGERLPLQVNIYGGYSSFHARQFGQQIADLIVEHGLQDRVTLMPMITPDAMLAEYGKHHLFVYSGWESRPEREPDVVTYQRATGACGTRLYSLIEAMAAGLPVVCSSECHVVGAIENGGNGLVFEKGDATDLGAKIEAISQMDLAAMGARSRALIEAHHDAQDFPARFELLLADERKRGLMR